MSYSFFSSLSRPLVRTLVILLSVSVLFSSCSRETPEVEPDKESKEPVKIVYVDWASEVASANVIKAVIRKKMGRECELLPVSLNAMWQALAAGDQDGMVAAWLPSLQAKYRDKYGSDVEYLGPNLEGTRIGLVVPEYVGIDSIKELSDYRDKFDSRIIGIDPQAGIMKKTETAMQKYQLDNFKLISGSGPTMTKILKQAIDEERWIVVTGWTPHWKFARWDLKYLKDPRNVYGDKEYIGTFVRQGLKKDMPEVYTLLDNFKWRPEDMEQVMLYARSENTNHYQAALRWIKENDSIVNKWLNQ